MSANYNESIQNDYMETSYNSIVTIHETVYLESLMFEIYTNVLSRNIILDETNFIFGK